MSLGQQQTNEASVARGLGAASVRGLVCCDDPCEDALAKQWSLLTGRGNVQTLRGPYAGRAGRARCAGRAPSAEGAPSALKAPEKVPERAAGLAVRSECARGYEPLHGAEQAAERGCAGGSRGTAAGEAGDGGFALVRRCGPLP